MGGSPDQNTRLRKRGAAALVIASCASIIGWASAELYQAAVHGRVFGGPRWRAHWVSPQDSPELFWFNVCIDVAAIAISLGSAVLALFWRRDLSAPPSPRPPRA